MPEPIIIAYTSWPNCLTVELRYMTGTEVQRLNNSQVMVCHLHEGNKNDKL